MKHDEIRAAVRVEVVALVQHLRDTIEPGKTYDDWMRDALDWYIEEYPTVSFG